MQPLILSNKIQEYLAPQLQFSVSLLASQSIYQIIQQIRNTSQNKVYHSITNHINQYFETMWTHSVHMQPDFEITIPELLTIRSQNVYNDILSSKLSIQNQQYLSPFMDIKEHEHALRHKLEQINSDLVVVAKPKKQVKEIQDLYDALYSQQKIKQTEQFIKQKRAEQIQRQKRIRLMRHKQEEQQRRLSQEKKLKEEEQKIKKKQEILKKKQQGQKRRQKQQMLREQRKSQFLERKKIIDQKTPLFKKLQQQYFERSMKMEVQSFDRMHNERKYFLQRFDAKSLNNHQKHYQQKRERKQKQRQQRYSQMAQQQKERHAKFHNSYHINKQPDPDQIYRQKAKQKNQKIKQYRAIVRQKFQPKVDPAKKQQLINLIRDLEFKHKKVKKVLKDDGSVSYEVVEPTNKKILGVGYLQSVKQLIAKNKKSRKKDDNQVINSNTADLSKKKPIDYLQQFRKNRRDTKSRAKSDFTSMVSRRDLSFDDKVKKVMIESEKMEELTKINEMRLKHGKFKTSEQILACKDSIDQNYLDIVNMKLKLLQNQARVHYQDQQQSNDL